MSRCSTRWKRTASSPACRARRSTACSPSSRRGPLLHLGRRPRRGPLDVRLGHDGGGRRRVRGRRRRGVSASTERLMDSTARASGARGSGYRRARTLASCPTGHARRSPGRPIRIDGQTAPPPGADRAAPRALRRRLGAPAGRRAARAAAAATPRVFRGPEIEIAAVRDLELPGPAGPIPARLYVPAGPGDRAARRLLPRRRPRDRRPRHPRPAVPLPRPRDPRPAARGRLPARTRAPLPGRGRRRPRRLPVGARGGRAARRRPRPDRGRRRQRRRQPRRGRRPAAAADGGAAPAFQA